VAAALEELGGEGEGRLGGALRTFAEKACRHPGERGAVAPHHGYLDPVRGLPDRAREDVLAAYLATRRGGTDHGRLPARGDVNEDVVATQRPFLVECPARHASSA